MFSGIENRNSPVDSVIAAMTDRRSSFGAALRSGSPPGKMPSRRLSCGSVGRRHVTPCFRCSIKGYSTMWGLGRTESTGYNSDGPP